MVCEPINENQIFAEDKILGFKRYAKDNHNLAGMNIKLSTDKNGFKNSVMFSYQPESGFPFGNYATPLPFTDMYFKKNFVDIYNDYAAMAKKINEKINRLKIK